MQINLLWCAPYLIKEHYYPGGSKLNLSFWRGHNPWEQVLQTPCTWTTFHSWSWIQRRPQNVMYKKHSSHSLSQSFFIHRENCLWPYVGYFWYFVISCMYIVYLYLYICVFVISCEQCTSLNRAPLPSAYFLFLPESPQLMTFSTRGCHLFTGAIITNPKTFMSALIMILTWMDFSNAANIWRNLGIHPNSNLGKVRSHDLRHQRSPS